LKSHAQNIYRDFTVNEQHWPILLDKTVGNHFRQQRFTSTFLAYKQRTSTAGTTVVCCNNHLHVFWIIAIYLFWQIKLLTIFDQFDLSGMLSLNKAETVHLSWDMIHDIACIQMVNTDITTVI